MSRPTSKQIGILISHLKSVLSKDGGLLDMMQPEINTCGTPMCHGGWYALDYYKDDLQGVSYRNGRIAMKETLGCNPAQYFDQHPELWGNIRAIEMFVDEHAFISKSRPNGATSLKDIIKHWQQVKNRIVKLERNENL